MDEKVNLFRICLSRRKNHRGELANQDAQPPSPALSAPTSLSTSPHLEICATYFSFSLYTYLDASHFRASIYAISRPSSAVPQSTPDELPELDMVDLHAESAKRPDPSSHSLKPTLYNRVQKSMIVPGSCIQLQRCLADCSHTTRARIPSLLVQIRKRQYSSHPNSQASMLINCAALYACTLLKVTGRHTL